MEAVLFVVVLVLATVAALALQLAAAEHRHVKEMDARRARALEIAETAVAGWQRCTDLLDRSAALLTRSSDALCESVASTAAALELDGELQSILGEEPPSDAGEAR